MYKILLVLCFLPFGLAFAKQDVPSTEFILDTYLALILGATNDSKDDTDSSDEINEVVGFEQLNSYYVNDFEYVVEINLLERFKKHAYGYDNFNPRGFPTISFTPFDALTCSSYKCFDIELGSIQSTNIGFKFRIAEDDWQFYSITDATFKGIEKPSDPQLK